METVMPKLNVSGYRGVWGTTLTEDIAREYTRAFALFIKNSDKTNANKKVLVGRDGRESGAVLVEAVIDELTKAGIDVVFLSIMPTPTCMFLIKEEHTDGAIIVTASHNPIQYNGLKFATGEGAFTTEEDIPLIESFRGKKVTSDYIGTRTDGSHLFDKHLAQILKNIDAPAIRAKKFHVACDTINSVGCKTTPELMDSLGVTYSIINGEPTGHFAHLPEPVAKNLVDLQALVPKTGSVVGFAQDPDGDRLVLIDETGTPLSEDMMLCLCIKSVLSKTPGDIVINLSTTNVCEDIATSFGVKTFRSKVGEPNVATEMKIRNAVVGGETGGGIIWPAVYPVRDSFVGMSLILELLARDNRPLSVIAADLPRYTLIKEKFSFTGDLPTLFVHLQEMFPDAIPNPLDGLRLDFPDRSWVHVRHSNTEPIVRIFAEAKTEERAKELMEKAKSFTK